MDRTAQALLPRKLYARLKASPLARRLARGSAWSLFGSAWARFAFMGKSVRGRLSVDFRSSVVAISPVRARLKRSNE